MKEFSKEIHLAQLRVVLEKILLSGYSDMFLRHREFQTKIADGSAASYTITFGCDAQVEDTDCLRFLTIKLEHSSGWNETVMLDFPQSSVNVFTMSILSDPLKPFAIQYARINRVLTHILIKLYDDFTVDGEPRNKEIQYFSSNIINQILTDRGNVSRAGTKR